MMIALVLGTRPQIIKSAPILHATKKFTDIEIKIIHTGQHYDFSMSKVFFNELSIPDPIVNLGVGSGSHGQQTGEMIIKLEKCLSELKPQVVLVPGDTNSTLAGAIASAKMQIPVAHVESGARSFDRRMPEEINRVLVDHCSDLLFAVSENCIENLVKEGIPNSKIKLVGDTMYESLQNHLVDISKEHVLQKYGLEINHYLVLTIHRVENSDDAKRLNSILNAVSGLGIRVIFPCHPRTKAKLENNEEIRNSLKENITIVDSLPYFSMLNLVSNAKAILTDSGGLQKEAYWLKKPCITLRENTEWVETVEAGANVLIGSNFENIKTELNNFENKKIKYNNSLTLPGASEKILSILSSFFA